MLVDIIAQFWSQRRESSSEIPAHGIYRSVKLFLQPITLREINIMMKSWNYYLITSESCTIKVNVTSVYKYNHLFT